MTYPDSRVQNFKSLNDSNAHLSGLADLFTSYIVQLRGWGDIFSGVYTSEIIIKATSAFDCVMESSGFFKQLIPDFVLV